MSIATSVKTFRDANGWTLEELSERSSVSWRQLQRIEHGDVKPRAGTLQRLAKAFGIDVMMLQTGVSLETLLAAHERSSCPHCGSELFAQMPTFHELGDGEIDVFECGHTRGDISRPCPDDPRFPAFEDYELTSWAEEPGRWYSEAHGRTDAARQVSLQGGVGRSKGEAEALVKRAFIHARYGYEAAQEFLRL